METEQSSTSFGADRLIVLGAMGVVIMTLNNIKTNYKHTMSDSEYDYLLSIASQLEDLGQTIFSTFNQEK